MSSFAEQVLLLLIALVFSGGLGGVGWTLRRAALHLRSVTEHLVEIDRRVGVLETHHQAQAP